MSVARYFEASEVPRRVGLASRLSDLGLVAAVVAIIALMVLPLPTLLIDTLVAINMMFGVLLLLAVLYIRSPLELSAFPSILLISTLFRLSLGIATTRMILLDGDAGDIIRTFGEMVVGGNLVVGLVVFLIITIVQFIVIAKGAERVAEVAARFSLDAMPGKQLSIDSDLRSGLLDKDEARKKRKNLELESKLHGSLDGAMKFVKGDAIAGIIIVIVNLLGGLAIGALMLDMEFGDAVHKYSILSIGDGLVSQIPALLGAMSAGLVVTRTTDDDDESNLGEIMRRQVTGNPRVLMIGGGIALAMSFIPGFPTAVFLGLGFAAALAGAAAHPRLKPRVMRLFAPAQSMARRTPEPTPSTIIATPRELKPIVPLLLVIESAKLTPESARKLGSGLTAMLNAMQFRVGLPAPKAELHLERDTPLSRWRLLAFEVEIGGGEVNSLDDVERLPDLVEAILRRNLQSFIGVQEATDILNRVGIDYPEVVKEAARALPTTRIAEILRLLVQEEVPLRNMRDALEALAEAGAQERDPGRIADLVRIALKRYLLAQCSENGRLRALVVSTAVEDMVRAALRQLDGADRLAMEPAQAAALIAAIRAEVRSTGARAIVTSFDVRRPLRRLIEPELFDTPVLSFNELSAQIQLDVAGQLRPPVLPERAGPEDHA